MPRTLNPHSMRLLKELVINAHQHGLVLFVGSGINPSTIPLWSELLDSLLNQTVRDASLDDPRIRTLMPCLVDWCKRHFDACAQASIVKKVLGPERYRLEIQDALYK